jgi:hypothetical protein
MKQITTTAMLRMRVAICFDSKPHTGELYHHATKTWLHSLAKVPVGDLLIGTQPNSVQGFTLSFCEINHKENPFFVCRGGSHQRTTPQLEKVQ